MTTIPSASGRKASFWIDFLACFCVVFLACASLSPDVNESHYLPKARAFWDANYAPNDIFLSSGNAHWLFFATFGTLHLLFPFATAAWIGRIISWLLFSIAWTSLANNSLPSNTTSNNADESLDKQTAFQYKLHKLLSLMPGTLSMSTFLMLVELGNLSGEWAVGGIESKSIAYAFIFWGLSFAIQSRWQFAWPMLGIASAFHVVIGAWATLDLLIVFAFASWFRPSLLNSWKSLIIGGILSLIGVMPALLMNRGVSSDIQNLAATIYVYERLPHHLSPATFATERWIAWQILFFAGSFSCFALMLAFARHRDRSFLQAMSVEVASFPCRILWPVAWIATLIGLTGLGIDTAFRETNIDLAAQLLRLYWFRWNDVALPIAISLTFLYVASRACSHPKRRLGWVLSTLLLIPIAWVGLIAYRHSRETIPKADQLSLFLPNESKTQQIKIYKDWVRVCDWIRENTPKDSLWLTPRYQQTFKWRAERAEVAGWKDVPQDALHLVQWWNRIRNLHHFARGIGLLPPDIESLRRFQFEYGSNYILVDQRISGKRLPYELLYPSSDEENKTYAVYRMEPFTETELKPDKEATN